MWFKGYIYEDKLNKACFSDDVAYSDNKDLAKITHSGKILKDKAYHKS